MHYYAEGLGGSAELCELHGWPKRATGEEVEIWDAVLLVRLPSQLLRAALLLR